MYKQTNPFRCLLLITSCLGCCLFSVNIFAQNTSLSPDLFLPHPLGVQFTAHHQLVDYFEYLAKNNPNTMLLERYGTSNEERPLQLAIFSSKENMANIEEIRLAHLADAGFGAKTDKKTEKAIAIVWLSMSVHGNEPSGSECSLELAYRLATQSDQQIQKWLENTVVILDPSVNPDGYSRYTHWYRGVSALHSNSNPDAREHIEPWPGGRVNHYYFDLNRDWAWATQAETQQRLVSYHKWLPHVHADLHEQYINNPYYFAPAAEPMHHYITPFQRQFQSTIGQNHAGYFDKNGWLYFTREIFDLFYPSYGDTYPMFNGAIGMTYEQAGHGTAGRAIELANGDTLRLSDRILHHLTTSLSTIETASRKAEELQKAFTYYFSNASENPPGTYTSFILKNDNDPAAISSFLKLLDRHNIQYGRSGNGNKSTGFSYKTGTKVDFSIDAQDIVINAHQPQAVLLEVLLEPEGKLSDTLTYDITAWSLPMAFGLNAYATKENISAGQKFEEKTALLNQYKAENNNAYAWCIPPAGLNTAKATSELLQKGYTLRLAKTSFQNSNKNFPNGTIILTKADNKTKWDKAAKELQSIANDCKVEASPIQQSWTDQGPNFGSEAFQRLDFKQIAVVYGDEVDPNAYGFVWHFLEHDLNMPFAALPLDKLKQLSPETYSVVILPEGNYPLSSETLLNLAEFVKKGGKLIASGAAIKAFGAENPFDIALKTSEDGKSTQIPNYINKERSNISNSLPGAVVKLQLDAGHPLATGLGDSYWTLKTSILSFDMPEKADAIAWVGDELTSFGFIGAAVRPKLLNTAEIISKPMGKGQAIFFADDPLFRGFWYQGKVLFANALFY